MSTIYDISRTSMKIGVAVPIVNPSFQFWDDAAAGMWAVPTGWTNANLTNARRWLGYDDDRASLQISAASAPDDYTYIIKSKAMRFWNDNDLDLVTNQEFYGLSALMYDIDTPGGNVDVGIRFAAASTEAMTSPNTSSWKSFTTGTDDTAFTLYKQAGIVPGLGGVNYYWGQVQAFIRDVGGATSLTLDTLGLMFNPFDDTGYLELTNVFPANGPSFAPENFMQVARTPLGTRKRADLSGGNRIWRLQIELRNESVTVYQNLKRFWDMNFGPPGIAPYPLLLEPNVPALPPCLLVDFIGNRFPLRRSPIRAERYSGVLEFETVF